MNDARIFTDDGDRLMSLDETAARLRTSPAIVGKLVKTGILPCIRRGTSKSVRKYTLNAFLAQHDGEDLFELLEGSK